jgi:hydrogenase nickel incorporation protein HypA/HybF
MHELSIAMSIVEMVQEEAQARDLRIKAVHLKLGAIAGVVKEALLSSYGIVCDGTPLEGSQLLIEDVPLEVFCPICNQNRTAVSVQWLACPECGAATSSVVHGKELEVTALEVE